jgi:hypothetical protein
MNCTLGGQLILVWTLEPVSVWIDIAQAGGGCRRAPGARRSSLLTRKDVSCAIGRTR